MSRPPASSDRLRTALRELAEADAGELIVQARERARTSAVKLIEDALVEELVEAATRTRGQQAGAAPRAHPEERPGSRAWWAYCVMSARDADAVPAELEGVEPGSAVEVLREDGLAALISQVPADEYDDVRLREHLEDLAWLERTARRHEAVLEAVLREITILPLRLCTLYRDHDGVRRLLRDHAEPLARSLARIHGCAEWGVKVFAGRSASADEEGVVASEDREGLAERPGATYLVQRQRERERADQASELRATCVEEVHRQAAACAREATTNPPQRPELHGRETAMLLNGAYLVPHPDVEQLHRTIEALRGEWQPQGFVIELTGPWPPYNFVAGAPGVIP
jgi:hypothetical protein